jgi:hypothetical protein
VPEDNELDWGEQMAWALPVAEAIDQMVHDDLRHVMNKEVQINAAFSGLQFVMTRCLGLTREEVAEHLVRISTQLLQLERLKNATKQ